MLEPEFVIVDTMARSMTGSDENNAKEMGIFIEACDRIKRDFGCAVMIVHHAGKSGVVCGSSALKGATDMMIELRAQDDVTQMLCEKSKNTSPFEPRSLKLLPKEITLKNPDTGQPESVKSAVMVDADLVIQTESDDLPQNQRAILDMLKMSVFEEEGASRSEIAQECRMSTSSTAKALSSLLSLNFISQEAKYKPYQITPEGRQKVSKVPKVPKVPTVSGVSPKTENAPTPKNTGTSGTLGITNDVSLGEGLRHENGDISLIEGGKRYSGRDVYRWHTS